MCDLLLSDVIYLLFIVLVRSWRTPKKTRSLQSCPRYCHVMPIETDTCMMYRRRRSLPQGFPVYYLSCKESIKRLAIKRCMRIKYRLTQLNIVIYLRRSASLFLCLFTIVPSMTSSWRNTERNKNNWVETSLYSIKFFNPFPHFLIYSRYSQYQYRNIIIP